MEPQSNLGCAEEENGFFKPQNNKSELFKTINNWKSLNLQIILLSYFEKEVNKYFINDVFEGSEPFSTLD